MKRKFSLLLTVIMICTFVTPCNAWADENNGPFKLPDLPYSYDALEPYIDAQTMTVHHQKHHGTYVAKLNDALKNHPELKRKTLEELLMNLNKLPQDIREAVRNNGGGHYNHSLFWTYMGQNKGGEPTGKLKEDIIKSFGSYENFKKLFKDAALNRFGSGWVWLIKDKEDVLKITSTANQDSPIMEGIKPLLGLDLWEHAYYLKYQNKRGDYVDSWWKVVNWEQIQKNYK